MTREEQIIETAKEYYNPKSIEAPYSLQMRVGFATGANWADETMLDRACEWLKENMYVEHVFGYSNDNESIQYVCASAIDSVEEFIAAFRQAMGRVEK